MENAKLDPAGSVAAIFLLVLLSLLGNAVSLAIPQISRHTIDDFVGNRLALTKQGEAYGASILKAFAEMSRAVRLSGEAMPARPLDKSWGSGR